MNTWHIDAAHTQIGFKVKHLMISTVHGQFTEFEGTLTSTDESFSDAKIHFNANVASITTQNAMRDGHLKSGEFFDAENFPKVTFESTSFTKKEGNIFEVKGNFTMRGVTKEIVLRAEFGGNGTSVDGKPVVAFDITGRINRMDFGVNWNKAIEAGLPAQAGGWTVSEEVTLDIAVELKKEE